MTNTRTTHIVPCRSPTLLSFHHLGEQALGESRGQVTTESRPHVAAFRGSGSLEQWSVVTVVEREHTLLPSCDLFAGGGGVRS